MATILPPAPTTNDGSRESSEFEFVGKGVATKTEETSSLNILTNIEVPSGQPKLVSVPARPIMEHNLVTGRPTTLPERNSPVVPDSRPFPGQAAINIPLDEVKSPKSSTAPDPNQAQSSAGMFGWVRSNGLLSKVVEKTRSVTENVITTLDPQMKDFIHSGGDVQIVVASDKDDKVLPIREAFQNIFGQATIVGLPSKSTTIAEQPVGFASGKQAALERISSLRKAGSVQKETVVVSVENFLYEVSENIWLDMSCLILSDPQRKIQLQTYSQPTSVPVEQIKILQQSTAQDYPKRWSGFSTPIGKVMSEKLNVPPSEWQTAITGLSRRRLLLVAGEGLAGMYQKQIQAQVENV